MTNKRVLVVFPNAWDRKQLASCYGAWCEQYDVTFGEPTDEGCPWDFDILSYIDRTVEEWRGAIHGVTSSSDYPGATVAGAVATRLGLPGPAPGAVIRCSHKYYSRMAQRDAVPEATPAFALIDPIASDVRCPIGYPCFIKPVKGAFSVMARRLDSADDLVQFLARPAVQEFTRGYVHIFNQLVAGLTNFEINGSFFLAEELLHGTQVTVEGFVTPRAVTILGVIDSVKHPDTGSFVRFDYPSRLDASVVARMAEVARRAIAPLGLMNSMFNIEMIFDPKTDQIHIIEINPRICGQFADLYQKVDGANSYEIALALCTGAEPVAQRRQGAFAAASSIPLRVFEPVQVRQAPDAGAIRGVETDFPGTLVWSECETGQTLSDFESLEDGQSYRYGIINVGGSNVEDVVARSDEIRRLLRFDLVRA